jgi:hypothetical protein
MNDPDWRIRHEVAGRIALTRLIAMQDDPDPVVREVARHRLGKRHEVSREQVI